MLNYKLPKKVKKALIQKKRDADIVRRYQKEFKQQEMYIKQIIKNQ